MEENVMIVPDEEIGVDELEENLTGEVEQLSLIHIWTDGTP